MERKSRLKHLWLAFALPLGVMIAGMAPASAGAGFQGIATYNVPTGLVSLFYHYSCPAQYPYVHNGAFAMNGIGQSSQVSLAFNGPRLDTSPPSYNQWGWHFYWPGGAPAGTSIRFNVACYGTP